MLISVSFLLEDVMFELLHNKNNWSNGFQIYHDVGDNRHYTDLFFTICCRHKVDYSSFMQMFNQHCNSILGYGVWSGLSNHDTSFETVTQTLLRMIAVAKMLQTKCDSK